MLKKFQETRLSVYFQTVTKSLTLETLKKSQNLGIK